jgi:hypothetical protein
MTPGANRICVRAGGSLVDVSNNPLDMADITPTNAVARSTEIQTADEFNRREAWFTNTPDPWSQIVTLEFGGDRTYATTVRQMIVNAEPAQHGAMQAKLLDALANREITDAGRQFVCRMLGLVGTAESVPALTELLNDDATADVARSALDFMADPAVDEAYRAALGKLTGGKKIGLIGSMAKRPGDERTIDALQVVASDTKEEAAIRTAAKRALEMFGVEVRS